MKKQKQEVKEFFPLPKPNEWIGPGWTIAFNYGDLIIRQGRERLTIVLADFDSSKATIYPEKYKDLQSIAVKYPAEENVELELFIPEKAEPILTLNAAVRVNLPQAVAQKPLAVLKGESDLSQDGGMTMVTFGKNSE